MNEKNNHIRIFLKIIHTLKQLQIKKNITNEELAKYLNISKQELDNLYISKRFPTLYVVIKLKEKFPELDLNALLT